MPITITPTGFSGYGNDIQLFTASTITYWAVDGGSLWLNAGATVPYDFDDYTTIYVKMRNKTGTYTLDANNGVIAGEAALSIIGKFPSVPHLPHAWKPTKRGVVTVEKRDGSVSGKVQGSGLLARDFKLQGKNRRKAEIAEIEQFFDDHFPNKTFYYYDEWKLIGGIYKFDSDPSMQAVGHQHGEFELAIKQVI